jgi:hypothetical protein
MALDMSAFQQGRRFAGTEWMMPDSRDKNGLDPRFDRWLSRRLHEAYDSVLKEALPADLERLVQQLAVQENAARSNGASQHPDGSQGHRPEERPHGMMLRTAFQLRN